MRGGLKTLLAVSLVGGGMLAVFLVGGALLRSERSSSNGSTEDTFQEPRELVRGRRLTMWWDMLPDEVREKFGPTGLESNIHPRDYTGPESCKECHPRNYESWSRHPH